jgi:hypothetical protein
LTPLRRDDYTESAKFPEMTGASDERTIVRLQALATRLGFLVIVA